MFHLKRKQSQCMHLFGSGKVHKNDLNVSTKACMHPTRTHPYPKNVVVGNHITIKLQLYLVKLLTIIYNYLILFT